MSLLVGLGASPVVSAADPDNTIYVVGKYATGQGAIRAYDLSDSNATDNDGRTIPTTAATNGFVGVALDPLTQILYVCEQGNQTIQAHDANNLTPFSPMDIALDATTTCGALEIDPFRRILYVGGVDAYSINGDVSTGNFGTSSRPPTARPRARPAPMAATATSSSATRSTTSSTATTPRAARRPPTSTPGRRTATSPSPRSSTGRPPAR
ncbi:MAG: hypothetical protein IPN01_13100 [Deltaproteobacteria bacterium]|nr:hypothetical protein [Deltaproteobacteria bacterium]